MSPSLQQVNKPNLFYSTIVFQVMFWHWTLTILHNKIRPSCLGLNFQVIVVCNNFEEVGKDQIVQDQIGLLNGYFILCYFILMFK